jgi:hypothetical protein
MGAMKFAGRRQGAQACSLHTAAQFAGLAVKVLRLWAEAGGL